MKAPSPRGLTAVILAGGLAVSVIALAIGAELANKTLSEQEASVLSTVLGAVVGALATYLGARSQKSGPAN